ncbi:MAG: cytochrome c554 family protein [Spirochaetes bacterium]|nr:cytochrome c554 family protein [Spirochaetota bacterium]
MKSKIVIIISMIALTVYAFFTGCKSTPHYTLAQFISPATCGGCHDEIYEQWKNSMHNLAQKDIIYKEYAAFYLDDIKKQNPVNKDELEEAESCVKCHIPVGFITGKPVTVTEELAMENELPEITKEGIQCDYCHVIVDAKKNYNAHFTYKPGNGEADPGVKYGPFKDATPDWHQAAYSKFHTQAAFCGTCHDVRHVVYNTKLETTFEEWSKSPYNTGDEKTTVPCQGCHMYHRPGVPATGSTPRPNNPGFAAFGGPQRDHIFTHYFVGGNSVIPGLYNDKVKGKMAEERLKNAATILIDTRDISTGAFAVTITNTGAGHKLPTGLTDVRQMWLEIVILNQYGKEVFSIGKADKRGYLPDNTIIFKTIFGDGKGKPVVNIAKAKEILFDNRISPKESATNTIILPKGLKGKYSIQVRLLYRLADQKAVDEVMKDKAVKLPVIEMATAKKEIVL